MGEEGETGRHRCAGHRVGARSHRTIPPPFASFFLIASAREGQDVESWIVESRSLRGCEVLLERQSFGVSFYFCSNLILRYPVNFLTKRTERKKERAQTIF